MEYFGFGTKGLKHYEYMMKSCDNYKYYDAWILHKWTSINHNEQKQPFCTYQSINQSQMDAIT